MCAALDSRPSGNILFLVVEKCPLGVLTISGTHPVQSSWRYYRLHTTFMNRSCVSFGDSNGIVKQPRVLNTNAAGRMMTINGLY